MATYISDTFTEVSNTELSLHTPDVGGSWVLQPGYTGELRVNGANDYCEISAAPSAGYYNTTTIPTADYRVSFDLASSKLAVGALIRFNQTATRSGYFLRTGNTTSSGMDLYRFDAGAATLINNFSGNFSSVTAVDVDIETVGSTVEIEIFWDGVSQGTYVDSSVDRITVAGSCGPWAADIASDGAVDNFIVEDIPAPASSITLTDIAQSTEFTATPTTAAVPVSGTYVGTPTSIEARVVDDGTTNEVVTWTVIDASPSGGTFSGTIDTPIGGLYNVDVRFSNDTGILDEGTNGWSVVAPAGNSISLTDLTNNRVFQRTNIASNNAPITISGTYVGSPTNIEARIVDDGTTNEVVTWTTIEAGPTGGTFSGPITVPSGGPYNVDVRFSNDTGTTDEGTNGWLVGRIYAMTGQSNAEYAFNTFSGSPGTPNANVRVYDGGWTATFGGNGAVELANTLSTATGDPIALMNSAKAGSSLRQSADVGSGHWVGDTQTRATLFYNDVTAVGGNVEGIFWSQGERDARDESVSELQYHGMYEDDGLCELFTDFRANVLGPEGNTVQIILEMLGRSTDGTDSDAFFQGIRNAQLRASNAGPEVYHLTHYDLGVEASDAQNIHIGISDWPKHADRISAKFMDMVEEISAPLPRLVSCDLNTGDTVLTLEFDSNLRTAVTNYSTVGVRVEEGGSPVTITSFTRTSSRKVDIAFSAAITTPSSLRVYLGYGLGNTGGASSIAYPEAADLVLPNSAGTVNMPAEVFNAELVELV